MEDEEDLPPFWLQNTDRRSQASFIFHNSGVLLIILLVIVFVFVFIIVPSVVSFTSQIFRPHLIKKSGDYLNFVLVLFAIVCGFLGRNNNNNNSNSDNTSYRRLSNVQKDVQRSYPSTHANRWYDQYQDRPAYSSLNRLRSFSSYPDLRQESLWLTNDKRWRFYDDTHLNSYRVSSPSDAHRPQQQQHQQEQEEDVATKDVAVDTNVKEVVCIPPPPPPPFPPPQPPSPPAPPLSPLLPPPRAVRRKVKRTYRDLLHEKRKEEKDLEVEKFYVLRTSSATTSPAPSPPPVFSENEKRRGKDFLTSLRRNKKKRGGKSVENLESLLDPQPSSSLFIPSPSPPPPPPPPPHFFQKLFSSKKGKSKKVHSVPPPPPLPPPSVTSSSRSVLKIVSQNVTPLIESRASRTTTAQVAAVTAHQAPKAAKTGSSSRVEENVESDNVSPLIPIPPPPPPPFKMTSWKFVRDGDYVRVASLNSSRSGSPDSDSEDPSDKDSRPMARKDGGGDSTLAIFCPSPDVNTKAENFIARFRAGLKLEKINSVKGRSNLGLALDIVEGEGPS
ncbi:hypothetical protein GH714_036267 [Hevea brasiliensis]|uniref:Uncharacterized protein n=1 Tax=Hevea brasiliensis TaxID=3981 RepID=A0A6A6NEN0_HEVBR|nr:hypothetical protein GH714_036267 [Hevea brasiliensis]